MSEHRQPTTQELMDRIDQLEAKLARPNPKQVLNQHLRDLTNQPGPGFRITGKLATTKGK